MSVAVLVLAAGRGARLGGAIPKAFVSLRGVPLLTRSLEVMAAVPEVDRIVPVVPAADRTRVEARAPAGLRGLAPAVVGGARRQDSVRAGLDSLPDAVEWVAVHDAARCLVAAVDVSRTLAAARETGAALLAVPVRDTVKRVRDGCVVETPPRSACWLAQTPQVFRRALLREALDRADADGVEGTDDAALVERLGVRVRVVEGSRRNLKITFPEDLRLAEALLEAADLDAAQLEATAE